MKRLVVTTKTLYDSAGRWLGTEVIEVNAFTKEELKEVQCSECGYANGTHGEYWIKTGQHPFGSVEGFYRSCSKMTETNKAHPYLKVGSGR